MIQISKKGLEKENINERFRTRERLPVRRVCARDRKDIPRKWNNICEAMKSNVCSWRSKETG